MQIYLPQNNDIRERVMREISGDEEFNFTCNKNEYQFWKEMSEEEYDSLDIHSKEHEVGNVLIYDNGECFILDGLGFFRINFEFIK